MGVEVGGRTGVFVASSGAQAFRMNVMVINKKFLQICFINSSIKHVEQAMAFGAGESPLPWEGF